MLVDFFPIRKLFPFFRYSIVHSSSEILSYLATGIRLENQGYPSCQTDQSHAPYAVRGGQVSTCMYSPRI